MNESQEITLLRERSAQARSAADQASIAGSQEQRIGAYCLAEALELRLDQLLRARALPQSAKADLDG
jgi:hypothetical protein